jgi:hypothetical protein
MATGLNPVLAKMINNVYAGKTEIPNFEFVAKCDSAQIYKRDKSKIWIYVVRGWYPHYSEETADATALINSTIASRPRYKRVKAFLSKHPAPSGYRLLATGHSMGGAYCDQLIADGLVKEAISFNPAIQIKDIHNSGNTRYYNRNDFIYKTLGMYASNAHTINNTFFDKVDYALGFTSIIKSFLAHNLDQFEKPHQAEKVKAVKKDHPEKKAYNEDSDHESDDEKADHYHVQSVHLSKEYFEDLEHAKHWIAEHKYKVSDVDETPNEYRFRQMSPKLIETGHYRPKSVKIGDGMGYLIVLYK